MRALVIVTLAVAVVLSGWPAAAAAEPKSQVAPKFIDLAAPDEPSDAVRFTAPTATYLIEVRRFSAESSPGLAGYLQRLDLAPLQAGGSGQCLVPSDHRAAELLAEQPSTVLLGLKMFTDSTPNLCTRMNRRGQFISGGETRTVAARDVQGTRQRTVEKVNYGVEINATVKSLPNRSADFFRLLLEVRHMNLNKGQTVTLDGVDYPQVAGYTATANIEMQDGQILLLRGTAWNSAAGTATSSEVPTSQPLPPLYVVRLTRLDQSTTSLSRGTTTPAAMQANFRGELITTIPERWRAAELPRLHQLLNLPELADRQPGICVRAADADGLRLFGDERYRGLTTVSRMELPLPPGTDTSFKTANTAFPYRRRGLGAHLGDTEPPAGDPNPVFGDSVIAFECMDGDAAIFSFVIKQTVKARTARAGGIKAGEAHHTIHAQGTARLRIGETCYCRTQIQYFDLNDQPPVDAIFALTLQALQRPNPATDGSQPATVRGSRPVIK